MLIKVFSSGPLDTNIYILGCPKTRQAVLIDAPLDCSDWVAEEIEKYGLSIQMILLTHSHWDHTADVAILKEALEVPLYVHKDDAGNVENPGSDQLPLFFPIPPAKPDGYLTDGQLITIGDLQIEVIHTPGHTPGGVCFYLAKEKTLISGDTLFQGTMGRLDLPTGNPSLMWESLKKLATLPPDILVYPGHGDSTTIGAEEWIANAQKRFSEDS